MCNIAEERFQQLIFLKVGAGIQIVHKQSKMSLTAHPHHMDSHRMRLAS